MEHIKTSWKTTDGLNIFAQYWLPSGKPSAVICFVHGIGDHTTRHTHVAKAMTDAGFAFYTFDQRGHGQSDGKRGYTPSSEAVLSDVDLLIRHAKEQFPGIPVILYGHSMGGIIVLYYTLKRKPDIAGVISNSSGLHNALLEKPLLVMTARVLGSLLPKLAINNNLDLNGISRDPEVLEAYKTDPLVHDRITMSLGKIMLEACEYSLENAASFSLPVLLMHGKADIITFASGSEAFAKALPGKSTLVLLDEAYHEIHNEPEKEEVFSTMISWINKLIAK